MQIISARLIFHYLSQGPGRVWGAAVSEEELLLSSSGHCYQLLRGNPEAFPSRPRNANVLSPTLF